MRSTAHQRQLLLSGMQAHGSAHAAGQPTVPVVEPELAPLIHEIEEIGRRLEAELQYRVQLFNDDFHEFTDVVAIVQLATGCTRAKAWAITEEAHTEGVATAYTGSLRSCERVGKVFAQVRLRFSIE